MMLDLKKRDRICFLGDSITAHGVWIAEVIEYFVKNYPELKIGFYNCGISGSRGFEANLNNRLYCDCFNLFPKYVVVMFGMNDVCPYLYSPSCMEDDKVKEREKRLSAYEETLENIIDLCRKEDIIPIICAPTPYDEYNDLTGDNWEADIALKHCHDIAEKTAQKNGLLFVDMRSILMEHIKEKPIDSDRIHPNKFGQHLMSECFLKTIGAKKDIEPNKRCIISKKNLKRFHAEQELRLIMFMERDYMLWQYEEPHTLEERKRLVEKRLAEEPTEVLQCTADKYLKTADFKSELQGKIVRLMCEMY